MKALITGVAGQDGSYLAEHLLGDGHEVHGVVRGSLERDFPNLAAIQDSVTLHLDADYRTLIGRIEPDAVFHFASPTFVPDTWLDPAGTLEEIAGRTSELLAAAGDVHVVLAGSREMFGEATETPQNEATRCHPTSPYGVGKLAAFEMARVLRDRDGLHVSTAILYNHESRRRPERFVTRRVTSGVARIKLGLGDELVLGDLTAVRDWSAATDIVRAIALMAQQDSPDDYVLASGVGRTVRELVDVAFAAADLDADRYVRVDADLQRPPETLAAVGDPTRARERLGWHCEQSFEELVADMVAGDLEQLGLASGRT